VSFNLSKSHTALGYFVLLSVILLQWAFQPSPVAPSAWDTFWPSVASGALYSLVLEQARFPVVGEKKGGKYSKLLGFCSV
jgi:hypothetical protein